MKSLVIKNKRSSIDPTKLIALIQTQYLKKNLTEMLIGDIVKIGISIQEGNKDRIQYYQGIIIGKKNNGINTKIIVRKIFQGIGVERQFLIHSPKFQSIEILKASKTRRSKLYFLRKVYGKASRLKQKFNTR